MVRTGYTQPCKCCCTYIYAILPPGCAMHFNQGTARYSQPCTLHLCIITVRLCNACAATARSTGHLWSGIQRWRAP
jgi:hypothetical protein